MSLLKILLTNSCMFDCAYCINRRSTNVRRARFSVKEVVDLTLNFYKRNYIEGLFLSSGIIRSSDYTMELIVRVARSLREEHGFRGYIHLKSIPDADPALIAEAGRHADRLSINVELPTENGLKTFAPEKRATSIKSTMASLKLRSRKAQADKKAPTFFAGGPKHADDRRGRRRERRHDPQRPARRFMRATASSASITRRFRRSRTRAGAAARKPRRSSANIGSIRPTGCTGSTDFDAHEITASMDNGMLDLDDRSEARLGIAESRAISN